jgi:hypothetical protein
MTQSTSDTNAVDSSFKATSRYGGPLETALQAEGIGLGVGEGPDDYGYTVLEWDESQAFCDWLCDALAKRSKQ